MVVGSSASAATVTDSTGPPASGMNVTVHRHAGVGGGMPTMAPLMRSRTPSPNGSSEKLVKDCDAELIATKQPGPAPPEPAPSAGASNPPPSLLPPRPDPPEPALNPPAPDPVTPPWP